MHGAFTSCAKTATPATWRAVDTHLEQPRLSFDNAQRVGPREVVALELRSQRSRKGEVSRRVDGPTVPAAITICRYTTEELELRWVGVEVGGNVLSVVWQASQLVNALQLSGGEDLQIQPVWIGPVPDCAGVAGIVSMRLQVRANQLVHELRIDKGAVSSHAHHMLPTRRFCRLGVAPQHVCLTAADDLAPQALAQRHNGIVADQRGGRYDDAAVEALRSAQPFDAPGEHGAPSQVFQHLAR